MKWIVACGLAGLALMVWVMKGEVIHEWVPEAEAQELILVVPGGDALTGGWFFVNGFQPILDLWDGKYQDFLRVMLDPWGLWIENFTPRPTIGPTSATDCAAAFLIASKNPVVALWGVGIRSLETKGYALSDSRPAVEQRFRTLAMDVEDDLNRQFPYMCQVTVNGYTANLRCGDLWFSQYAALLKNSNSCSSRVEINARVGVDNNYWGQVVLGKIDPKTGFLYNCGAKYAWPKPYCQTPICPVGQHFVGSGCVACSNHPDVNACM